MSRQVLDVRRVIEASAETVWEPLGDSSTWSAWTPIDEFLPVTPGGQDDRHEVRRFRNGRHTVCEEVVERRPPYRLSYVLLAGPAVRDYRADIELVPLSSTRTELHWHTEFRPLVPGTGWLYRRALLSATCDFVDGLTRYCESS